MIQNFSDIDIEDDEEYTGGYGDEETFVVLYNPD